MLHALCGYGIAFIELGGTMQTLMMSERLLKLQEMLGKSPEDPFLLYGIGMEFKKAGERAQAIEYFNHAIEKDPAYCYAYFQKAQVHEQQGQTELARQAYVDGIAAAKKAGDAHAQSELESALAMME